MLLLGILIFVFLVWVIIYECIVYNNIRKACNIYINKTKYQKLQKEVNNNESESN